MNDKQEMTVKEVSEMTGLSVRSLHYYDEIGLLEPSKLTECGYRLYDNNALQVLQQILFFKELDIPLKEIKSFLENPRIDRKMILQKQRQLLLLKKKRIEALIKSIDENLKGKNNMDFSIFSKKEIEEFYSDVEEFLSPFETKVIEKEFGSLDMYKEKFLEKAGSEKAQKNFSKMMEWYKSEKISPAYKKRFDEIFQKLTNKMNENVSTESFEAKAVIGELDFVLKQYLQVDDSIEIIKGFLSNVNEKDIDKKYGKGFFNYFNKVVVAFNK